MRLGQGMFSFLPDLTDEQIGKQVQYALDHAWPISIEWTDDPHPRNSYWDMVGLPMFDIKDAAAILGEIKKAIAANPNGYVKVNAYDSRLGRQTTAMSFIVGRPAREPGFRIDRATGKDRQVITGLHAYSADKPHGERYE